MQGGGGRPSVCMHTRTTTHAQPTSRLNTEFGTHIRSAPPPLCSFPVGRTWVARWASSPVASSAPQPVAWEDDWPRRRWWTSAPWPGARQALQGGLKWDYLPGERRDGCGLLLATTTPSRPSLPAGLPTVPGTAKDSLSNLPVLISFLSHLIYSFQMVSSPFPPLLYSSVTPYCRRRWG